MYSIMDFSNSSIIWPRSSVHEVSVANRHDGEKTLRKIGTEKEGGNQEGWMAI